MVSATASHAGLFDPHARGTGPALEGVGTRAVRFEAVVVPHQRQLSHHIAMYATGVLILVAPLDFPVDIRGNGEPAVGLAAVVGLWSSRVTVACFAGLFSGFLMRSTNPRWAVFTVAAAVAGSTFQHSRHYDRPEYLWAHVIDRFPDSPGA